MMEGWQIALAIKPFALVIMFAPGALFVWWLRKRLPEGRLKRILFFSWRV